MDYNEEDFLQLSGLQHFCFCRRQWALIHIEQVWSENLRTAEGRILHERVHDSAQKESRKDYFIVRGMRVHSAHLGVSGNCDAVEFHRAERGIFLHGKDGLWTVYPIEYKHGSPRKDHANELQLCAQAICLEEMLCCDIPEGALYFAETRKRMPVSFSEDLRQEVCMNLQEMRGLWERKYTPNVKPTKSCNACSLKDLCLPKLFRCKSALDYMRAFLEDRE